MVVVGSGTGGNFGVGKGSGGAVRVELDGLAVQGDDLGGVDDESGSLGEGLVRAGERGFEDVLEGSDRRGHVQDSGVGVLVDELEGDFLANERPEEGQVAGAESRVDWLEGFVPSIGGVAAGSSTGEAWRRRRDRVVALFAANLGRHDGGRREATKAGTMRDAQGLSACCFSFQDKKQAKAIFKSIL